MSSGSLAVHITLLLEPLTASESGSDEGTSSRQIMEQSVFTNELIVIYKLLYGKVKYLTSGNDMGPRFAEGQILFSYDKTGTGNL